MPSQIIPVLERVTTYVEQHQRLIPQRIATNKREWKKFLAAGLDEAWKFVFGKQPKCPDLMLEEAAFRAALLLHLPVQRAGDAGFTELERLVRAKLAKRPVWPRTERRFERHIYDREFVAWQRDTKRRAELQRLATPPWANLIEIEHIKAAAMAKTLRTGIPHEVDHIVPICSVLVCGLHCSDNLRVIPQNENHTKLNRFDEALALTWPFYFAK